MNVAPRLRLGAYVVLFALRDLFPVSFFGRDLRERARTFFASLRSCLSAFLNLMTLTILVLTTALVAALYEGTVGWLRNYVESSPLARTVEVSTLFSTRTKALDVGALDELRSQAFPGKPAAIEGVFGWNDVTFWFFDSDRVRDHSLTHGRTVDPLDPLLGRLTGLSGPPTFSGDGVGQVIVERSLLGALGFGREPPFPPSIQLDFFDVKAPVEVVGVVEDAPEGDFLITEAFHRALEDRRWDPLPRFAGLYWGPVSATEDLAEALAKLAPWLARQQVELELVRRAGTEQWLRVERGEPWTEKLWRQLFVPPFEEALGGLEPAARLELFEALPPDLQPMARQEPVFSRASVYVRELADVPAVAERVGELGYRVTSNSREMALLFLQVSALGRRILQAVIVVVGGLSAVSLLLSFSQSIQRKTPEIAILKAYGASNALVLAAYVLEALILWALSAAAGLLAASLAVRAVDGRLVTLLRLRGDLAAGSEAQLVVLPVWLQLSVAGGALLLCVGSTLLAGGFAVRLQPARALSLHR